MERTNTQITEAGGFASLAAKNVLSEAITDDFQGLEFNFARVKLPTGGGTAFEIPDSEKDGYEISTDITGVIIYNHPAYVLYQHKYTGGNNPPDCSSLDGIRGVGDPGGYCAECIYNRYGSGEGQSKLCKNKRTLYILREGELFTITLSLPAGSLKTFTNYVQGLMFRGIRLNTVVTEITLRKASNSSGIIFSQALFSCVRGLSDDEIEGIDSVSEMIKGYIANRHSASMPDRAPLIDPETGEVIEYWE